MNKDEQNLSSSKRELVCIILYFNIFIYILFLIQLKWDKLSRKDRVIKHRIVSKGVYKESPSENSVKQSVLLSTPISKVEEVTSTPIMNQSIYQTPIKPSNIQFKSEIDINDSLKKAEKNLLNVIFVLSGLFFLLLVLRYFI